MVGVDDFKTVNGNWGTCTDCDDLCCDCIGDTDFDCIVGVDDFLAVLEEWGFCPGFGACGGAQQEASGDLDAAVQALGFAGVDELGEWAEKAKSQEVYVVAQALYATLVE